MFEKTQVILIYAMVGISIALWPILLRFIPARFQTSSGSAKFTRAPAVVANVFGAILIATPLLIAFSSITTSPLLALTGICALIALTLAFHQGQLKLMTAIYIFAALLLTITLLWWQRGQLTWLEVVVFTTIVVGILRLTRNPPLSQVVPSIKAIQNSVFALVAVALSFTTTPLNDQTLLVAWHHWSAYIGPSELLLAGARIFVDFPAQ